jgi:transcriptional regulator with XRE-family HTH domain
VQKSIHSQEYQKVLEKLIALRQKAGLSQRDLAEKIGREQNFVWRIENGERRLDVVEFFWVCQALGQDALKVHRELIAAFQSETGKVG